jgi:hypothetical protein
MSSVALVVLGFALAMFGVFLGVGLAERAAVRASNLSRTGKLEPPAPLTRAPITSPSPEASATRRITQDMVERGTEDLLHSAREQGVPMSRDEAKRQVREMIEGNTPLGGAH